MPSLDDCDYKPDFEILDRYLDFSSELSRISLLAIGGFGAILLVKLKSEHVIGSLNDLLYLFIAICFFALCCGFSLFHRFFASDSMSWYISHLRAKANGNAEQAAMKAKDYIRCYVEVHFFLSSLSLPSESRSLFLRLVFITFCENIAPPVSTSQVVGYLPKFLKLFYEETRTPRPELRTPNLEQPDDSGKLAIWRDNRNRSLTVFHRD